MCQQYIFTRMHRHIENQYRFCSMCNMYADLHAFYSKCSEKSTTQPTRDSIKVLAAEKEVTSSVVLWEKVKSLDFFRFGLMRFCLIQFGEIAPQFCGHLRIYKL